MPGYELSVFTQPKLPGICPPVLQLAAYSAAQFIGFHGLRLVHQDGTQVGFLEYFDLAARTMAWEQDGGQAGEPLGAWGYGVRGLEILGFVREMLP